MSFHSSAETSSNETFKRTILSEYIHLNIYLKMKDNFDVFFRRKPAMMLVSLKKNTRMRYGSILAKEVDCTYSHAVKILQTLEELKLVVFEKRGRVKVIRLTKKGQEVADAIENIAKLVK
jgi:DNA-binding MarR family transcriptional regulator